MEMSDFRNRYYITIDVYSNEKRVHFGTKKMQKKNRLSCGPFCSHRDECEMEYTGNDNNTSKENKAKSLFFTVSDKERI